MKSDSISWKAKIEVARKLWREMCPDESHRRGRVITSEFSFYSTRKLAPGLQFETAFGAWRFVSDGTWSFRVRGMVYDARVSSLRSHVVGREVTGLAAFDFDVLAASCLVDNQPVPPSPELSDHASNDEIGNYMEEYFRRMSRIWSYFGGLDAKCLPSLATWMIRNREIVGADQGLAEACAAYIYGDSELSLGLLAEMEAELQERIRSGPKLDPALERAGFVLIPPSQESVRKIATKALEDIARLRGIVDRSHVH